MLIVSLFRQRFVELSVSGHSFYIMHVTNFIGRLIETDNLPIEKYNTVCAFSGEKIIEGIPLEIAIKKTFNDRAFLRYPSTHMSRNAYVCMARLKAFGRDDFELRKFHFIATEKELRILKREELQAILMKPPEPPFVLSITESNKKHRAFKASFALNQFNYPVTLDGMTCMFDCRKAREALPVMRHWYTILPDKENTKQRPTWFWKDHIRFGCTNQKMIAEYGINKYFSENQILEKFRGEPWFTLLLFTLNKGMSE